MGQPELQATISLRLLITGDTITLVTMGTKTEDAVGASKDAGQSVA